MKDTFHLLHADDVPTTKTVIVLCGKEIRNGNRFPLDWNNDRICPGCLAEHRRIRPLGAAFTWAYLTGE